ncbi:CRISPR-associated helicase Cas3' [Saccharopolyspora cebuensis]|uniref:CRISPR-associated helicase Cas3 n=1 Tax=Saccharopolyspora cebuensis TaxID=418759 RepID=A0ABV4CG36_9PSEU
MKWLSCSAVLSGVVASVRRHVGRTRGRSLVVGPEAVVDLRLWGKERGLGGARYPLACHGLDAAAAVRALWHGFVAPGMRERLATAVGVPESEACALFEFWAALHDIGKASPSFACQLEMPEEFPPDVPEVRLRHDVAAHLWLPSGLERIGYARKRATSVGRRVAQLLGGHHGTFHAFEGRNLRPESLPELGLGRAPVWEAERTALVELLAGVLAPPSPARLPPIDAAVLAGLVVLADWLVSQTGFVRSQLPRVPQVGDVSSLRTFFDGSLEPVRALVEQAGLSRTHLRDGAFAEEFPRFPPNALQASIARELPGLVTGPGLLMVAAPMGFGKTETALHAARLMGQAAGTSGLFVALPTMATADQMFSRVARYLSRRGEGETSQALLHGMAWLSPVEEILAGARAAEGISSDEESRVSFAEWLRGAKRGLLAGIGVGTIDQALLAVLPVRHNALRMFSLAGKTVVIDEVHAFDTYMRGLLKDLLSWLGELGVPVVLLSATLPRVVADELVTAYTGQPAAADAAVPYPGWLYVERGGTPELQPVQYPDDRRRPVEVKLRGVAQDAEKQVDRVPVLREVLAPVAEDGGCAAVICTTVAHAQGTYSGLREWVRHHGVQLLLLHSRFPARQRERITQQVLGLFGKPGDATHGNRPLRTVLVATQVVEQSLDLDLDLVVSDLAPIELLLQRAGRLQRHPDWDVHRPAWADPARGGNRRLVVLTAPDQDVRKIPGVWSYIYPLASLVRAHSLIKLHEHAPIRIPEDVQDLVDRGSSGILPNFDDELLCGFAEAEHQRAAGCMVEAQTAKRFSIGTSSELRNLAGLSAKQIDEERATTRFNADSERVLPYFLRRDGEIRLGGPDGEPLPVPTCDRLTREQAVAIMRHSIPYRAPSFAAATTDTCS